MPLLAEEALLYLSPCLHAHRCAQLTPAGDSSGEAPDDVNMLLCCPEPCRPIQGEDGNEEDSANASRNRPLHHLRERGGRLPSSRACGSEPKPAQATFRGHHGHGCIRTTRHGGMP